MATTDDVDDGGVWWPHLKAPSADVDDGGI